MDRQTFHDLREDYLETVLTELEPPQLRRWFERHPLQFDNGDIMKGVAMAKTANWTAHWRRRKTKWAKDEELKEDMADAVLAKTGDEFQNKVVEHLGQTLVEVERLLPQILGEIESRLEAMDDKALVAAAKLLFDMRRDTVGKLEKRYDKEKDGDAEVREERDTVLAELGLGHRLLDIYEGKERDDVIDAEFREEQDQQISETFAALDARINTKNDGGVVPDGV